MTAILDGNPAMEVSYLKPHWKKYIIFGFQFYTSSLQRYYQMQEHSRVFQTQMYVTGMIGNQFTYVR
jgi:hypothetical protein